ncbi:MAG: ornithine cyclodeaminase family protein [Pseudomonadota bacterium]
MKTLLLAAGDVRRIVRAVGVDSLMDELIARLETAIRSLDNRTEVPQRRGFHYDDPTNGMVEWMPAMVRGEQVVMKLVGYHPGNPRSHQLPTVVSTIYSCDPATGHLDAIVDGTLLTAMRTGAASAVASRCMASPNSRRLGLIGCGAQAVTQLHALGRLFLFEEIWINDTDPAALQSFPQRAAGLFRHNAEICEATAQDIMACADVVSVATSVDVGRGPVFDPVETRPHLHVNAVGSDFPGKTELPKSLLESSFVCADMIEQARIEGECQQLDSHMVHAEIRNVLRGEHDHLALQARRTVFDSTGFALEDLVACNVVLEQARTLGLGSEVEIECLSDDPKDPYALLGDATVLRLAESRIADRDVPQQTRLRSGSAP